jgi:AcrR family transcriptional regulator
MTDTRLMLVSAATALLDAGGPAGVTLREVGSRAGVSHNAPYKHFRDKESLLAAVAADELTAYRDILDSAKDLSYAANAYLARLLTYPQRFRLVYGPWTQDHEVLRELAEAAHQSLVEAVRRAQAQREIAGGPPELVGDLLRSTAHGAVELELGRHLDKGRRSRSASELMSVLLLALR